MPPTCRRGNTANALLFDLESNNEITVLRKISWGQGVGEPSYRSYILVCFKYEFPYFFDLSLSYFCGDHRPPFCMGILTYIWRYLFETQVLTNFQEAKSRVMSSAVTSHLFSWQRGDENEICPEILWLEKKENKRQKNGNRSMDEKRYSMQWDPCARAADAVTPQALIQNASCNWLLLHY